jgi:hypothetical protein
MITVLLDFFLEILYFVAVFGIIFSWSIVRGYWSVARLIVGLYFASLLFIHLPNMDWVQNHITGTNSLALFHIGLFLFLTLITTIISKRIIPSEGREGYFQRLPKKLLLTLATTILIMAVSFQILPVTDIVTANASLQSVFGYEGTFFWWLIFPLVVLYFI